MARIDGDAKFSEPRILARLAELRELLRAEESARSSTDAAALDFSMRVLERIQREALVNFGIDGEEDDSKD